MPDISNEIFVLQHISGYFHQNSTEEDLKKSRIFIK